MSELEDKLGAILGNPQMMQQIMSMAQSMGGNAPAEQKQEQGTASPANFDPGMLKSIAGLAGNGNIDKNQQTLLRALGPYLSRDRIQKLEKAMRAAKMARAASAFLGSGALQSLTGR